jgi:hypothetical protein
MDLFEALSVAMRRFATRVTVATTRAPDIRLSAHFVVSRQLISTALGVTIRRFTKREDRPTKLERMM